MPSIASGNLLMKPPSVFLQGAEIGPRGTDGWLPRHRSTGHVATLVQVRMSCNNRTGPASLNRRRRWLPGLCVDAWVRLTRAGASERGQLALYVETPPITRARGGGDSSAVPRIPAATVPASKVPHPLAHTLEASANPP